MSSSTSSLSSRCVHMHSSIVPAMWMTKQTTPATNNCLQLTNSSDGAALYKKGNVG